MRTRAATASRRSRPSAARSSSAASRSRAARPAACCCTPRNDPGPLGGRGAARPAAHCGPRVRPPHPRDARRHPRAARARRARARQGVSPPRPRAALESARLGRYAASRRADCPSDEKDLCGTGVAFKLAQALVPALGLSPHLPLHFLDLVALATVADVVPLTGENRILVRHGLKLLAESHWTGVRALVETAGLAGKPIRSGHVGFILAPRLNAAGRIGDANDGLRLLLSDDPQEAAAIARELETLNARRQALDQRILDEAVELAERVLGPGSGRSVAGFDLHAALHRVGQHLEKYGGHTMAAGLTIRRERYEAFRVAFLAVAGELLGPDDLVPAQRVDLELPLGLVSDELEKLIRYLEPCGPGNPAPVFGVRQARAVGARRVGTNHLRFTLDDASGVLPAIAFQSADAIPDHRLAERLDVAFRLERDEWQGRTTLQARVAAMAPSE